MELLEFISQIGGIGTELGLVNTLFILLLATVAWFIKREVVAMRNLVESVRHRDLGELLKEHDEMYGEFERNKANEESQQRKITKELLQRLEEKKDA